MDYSILIKAQGRVYVDCDGDYDGDEVVEALKRVFGIVGICPVVRKEVKDPEGLKKKKRDCLCRRDVSSGRQDV